MLGLKRGPVNDQKCQKNRIVKKIDQEMLREHNANLIDCFFDLTYSSLVAVYFYKPVFVHKLCLKRHNLGSWSLH